MIVHYILHLAVISYFFFVKCFQGSFVQEMTAAVLKRGTW